jgi:para-nitrobenzyl esterase
LAVDEEIPCIDGRYLREDPVATFAAGRQAKVPLLVGSNSQESDYSDLLPRDVAPTPESWWATLGRLFADRAGDALQVYPGNDTAEVLRSARALAYDQFIALNTWN